MIQYRTPLTIWICTLFFCAPMTLFAQDQEIDCEDVISTAEQHFFSADFDSAINALEHCIESPRFDEVNEAYLLLAQIHFATEDYEASKTAIIALLDRAPKYELPESIPPPIVAFFNSTKNQYVNHEEMAANLRPAPEYSSKQGFIGLNLGLDRRWYWIGGGVLAVGTAAVLMNGDEGGTTPAVFAPPPGPPGGGSSTQ